MRKAELAVRGWVVELRIWLDQHGVLNFAGRIKKEES